MADRDVAAITRQIARERMETTQRERTVSPEKTARSSVIDPAQDHCTAPFNALPGMIMQGQIIPISRPNQRRSKHG